VPLSSTSIICYQPTDGDALRSGVTLATRHRH